MYEYQMSAVFDNTHNVISREWLTEGKSGCCRAFAEHDNFLCSCSCSVVGRQGVLAMPKRVSADPKVLASVPLTASRGGACLWRPIIRDSHFHLPLHSWKKGLEESQGLFGSGSMMHFSCTHAVLCV